MCLIVKVFEKGLEEGRKSTKVSPVEYIKKSDGGITCYKIVMKVGKKYITPFQETKINWLTMHGITKFKAKGTKMNDMHHTIYNGEMLVYDGVIHSMHWLSDTQDFTDYIHKNSLDRGDVEIWKCVIPRGVKYMEGKDINGYTCFGSKSIRFKRRINCLPSTR